MVACFSAACSVTQSCPTLCDPMDCSPHGSSIHGISQAGILEWVAISSSKDIIVYLCVYIHSGYCCELTNCFLPVVFKNIWSERNVSIYTLFSVHPAPYENYILYFTGNPSLKKVGKLLPMGKIELTAYFYIAYKLRTVWKSKKIGHWKINSPGR